MGAMTLIGCLLIAYSVPTAIFFMIMLRKAQLVIVMLTSAFFWLLALVVSSLFWAAIPPLKNSSHGWAIIPVGVITQEIARAIFVRLYLSGIQHRSERSFSVVSINAIVFPLIDLYSAIAAGVGFGAIHTFMYYATIIAHSVGDGTLYSAHCPQISTFFSAAWMALFFNIMHIGWMVIAFDAYRRLNFFKVGLIFLLHAGATAATVLNNVDDGCTISLPLIGAITLLTFVCTVIVTHQQDYRSGKVRRVHTA